MLLADIVQLAADAIVLLSQPSKEIKYPDV